MTTTAQASPPSIRPDSTRAALASVSAGADPADRAEGVGGLRDRLDGDARQPRRHRARRHRQPDDARSACGSPRMPADSDHRFGHGKAEALAALVQVILITVSALGIAWRAVDRLMHGAQTEAMGLASAFRSSRSPRRSRCSPISARSIARTGSVAIKTDHVHYQSDLMLNGVGDRGAGARPGAAHRRRRRRCSASPSRCGCCGAPGARRAMPSTS